MTPPPGGVPADATDEALVDAARAGDRAALDALLRRHHDRIFVLCRRLCRDRGDAEDAAQNALIAIVRGLPHFDGDAAFTTWSYRVATNACLDELRRRGRRPVPSESAAEDLQGAVDRGARSGGPGTDPADAVVTAEQRGTVQAALDQLPEEFRLPVVLRDLAELDYAEIGEHLGLAPGTVRSRIARGRAKLARLLSATDLGGGNHLPTGNHAPTQHVTPQDEP